MRRMCCSNSLAGLVHVRAASFHIGFSTFPNISIQVGLILDINDTHHDEKKGKIASAFVSGCEGYC